MNNKFELHFIGDPVLRERANPVVVVDDDTRRQLDEMENLMHHESGAGLAAPQVGILSRMLVFAEMDAHGDKMAIHKMINPEIIQKSENLVCMEEGCLSIQGPNGPVFANVVRPEKVIVKWTDENGNLQERQFDALSSRAVQHEIDHLDGILFIDYLSSAKREMVMRKVKKRK